MRQLETYTVRGQAGHLLEKRRECPDHLSVFLSTSPGEYERRLRRRGTEGEEAVRRRLASALAELAHAPGYQYHIINDDLDRATAELRAVVAEQFMRAGNAG